MKKTNRGILDRVTINRPCRSDWDQMAGDDQARFCSECNKYVHDFSRMNRQQAERLVIETRGNLCARIVRDASGAIVTLEPPAPVHSAGRAPLLASPLTAAVLTATLGAGAATPAMARPARTTIVASVGASGRIEKAGATRQSPAGTASVTGNVQDSSGMGMAGVTVKLLDMDTGETTETTTAGGGSFQFSSLAPGAYHLLASVTGVSPAPIAIQLTDGQQADVAVNMTTTVTVTAGGAMLRTLDLMELVDESDLIVLASRGAEERTSNPEDPDSQQTRTTLTVQQTVKGRARGRITAQNLPEADETSQATPALFFLKKTSKTGLTRKPLYELADRASGLHALDSSAVQAYARHITQLLEIERGPHTPEDLTEWVVKLAEDPATRADGVEILQRTTSPAICKKPASDNSLDPSMAAAQGEHQQAVTGDLAQSPKDETSKDGAEPSNEGASADEPPRYAESPKYDEPSRYDEPPKYGDLLTTSQIERLADTLFNSVPTTEGDRALISFFQKRNDPRLAPYLLAQIRAAQDSPDEMTMNLAGSLAAIIKDDVVDEYAQQVAARYNDYWKESTDFDDANKDDGGEASTAGDNADAADSPSKTKADPAREQSLENKPSQIDQTSENAPANAGSEESHKQALDSLMQKYKSAVHAFVLAVDQYNAKGPAATRN